MTIKTAKIGPESLASLKKLISSPDNPKFFFTMTEINKVGINPRSKYNTPLAVYCYPLDNDHYTKSVAENKLSGTN